MIKEVDGLDCLKEVLSSDGSLAVTELPEEFALALTSLQREAPDCLRQQPQFLLPDGSLRQSFARDSQHPERFVVCAQSN